MSAPTTTKPREIPRLALTREETAKSIGVSVSHFEKHVQPELKTIYLGSKRLYRPDDIDQWLKSKTQ